MLESVFSFLFKFRPLLFQEGTIRLAWWGAPILLTLVAVCAVLVALSYRSVRAKSTRTDRIVFAALRSAILVLLAFCLLRPTLVLTRTLPQQNFVAVLVDDSRSMALGDVTADRADYVVDQLSGAEGTLLERLSERFAVRMFAFDDHASRVDSVAQLTFGGSRTDLAAALREVKTDLAGVPLAGVVVLSDGADNAGAALTEVLLPYKVDGVPVFTVGLGDEVIEPDVQVSRVDAPRRALKGGALMVDVVLAHTGYSGRSVSLLVEDDGRVISAQDVTLGRSGEPTTVPVLLRAMDAGPRLLRVRVPAQQGEAIVENNGRDLLLTVEDRTEKILYFDGEPRYEVSFTRRAVRGDPNLQLVILNRTADDKFIRLNVDDADELPGGFPATREELFKYRGLVLGSVEASFFTHDQLQMIADFVSRRGGSLLALGGRLALAEGGYKGTPLEEVFPVVLEDPPASPELAHALRIRPTRAGLTHPVLRIADTEEASADRWEELPPLSSFNPFYEVKAGATALLTAAEPDGRDRIIMAHHRYGRGKAIVLSVNDLWIWQMDASISLEDQTHEVLWRQMLRWLVEGSPNPVRASAVVDRVEPGAAVELRAQVEDSAFAAVNGARVAVEVSGPGGETSHALDWAVDRDGEYQGTLTPDVEGLYRIRVTAERGATAIGTDETYVRVAPTDAEFFDAGMRSALLERVADETGGRFYSGDRVATLPEDIQYTGGGVTITEEQDLWDMPIVLLSLLALLAAEWSYRRVRDLT